MLIRALDLSAAYVNAATYPVIVRTDHRPLLWLRHASSPMVVRWMTHYVQSFDFIISYRPGPKHGNADFMSRHVYKIDTSSPGVPTQRGILECLEQALGDGMRFIPSLSSEQQFFVYCPEMIPYIQEALQKTRRCSRPVVSGLPTARNLTNPWEFAIIIPSAERSVAMAAVMFGQNRPFALLMPSDLVHLVYGEDQDMANRVRTCAKLVFLTDNLVWLFAGGEGTSGEKEARWSATILTNSTVYTASHEIKRQQLVSIKGGVEPFKEYAEWAKKEGIMCWQREDLTIMLRMPGVLHHVTVPPIAMRADACKRAHLYANHGGEQATLRRLKAKHFWFGMSVDVLEYVAACVFCALANATRSLRAGTFSAIYATRPSECVCMDFAGPFAPPDEEGNKYVLVGTDSFGGQTMYEATKAATHEEVADFILRRQVFPRGIPSMLLSDCGTAFRARVIQWLCQEIGTDKIETAPYSQHQNGKAERRVAYLNRFLRSLSKEQYKKFGRLMPKLEAIINSIPDKKTGVAPAQIERPWAAPFDMEAVIRKVVPEEEVPDEMVSGYLKEVMEVYRLHVKVREGLEEELKAELEKLNARNARMLRVFEVGDRVAIHCETRHEGQSKKLIMQWRGPYRLIEKLASNIYRVQSEIDGSETRASGYNMVHYKPTTESTLQFLREWNGEDGNRWEPEEHSAEIWDQVEVGNLVAVWDVESDGKQYWIGRILEVKEESVELHYYGSLKGTVFSPVWVMKKDGSFQLADKEPRAKCSKWVGEEPIERIIAAGVELNSQGKLRSRWTAVLEGLRPTVMRRGK